MPASCTQWSVLIDNQQQEGNDQWVNPSGKSMGQGRLRLTVVDTIDAAQYNLKMLHILYFCVTPVD